eukprot:5289678-Amphidinium_carterae.4
MRWTVEGVGKCVFFCAKELQEVVDMASFREWCSVWAYRWENFVKSSATRVQVRAHNDKGGVVQARQVAHEIMLILLMNFRWTVSYGPMKVDNVDD